MPHRLPPFVLRLACSLACSLALLAPLAGWSQPVVLEGVKYERTAQIGNVPLQLQGAGIRYKVFFKVYTAGLYLTTKAGTTEAVLAAPGPKRMHIVMLRDIDANELGKLFTKGMEQNSPREEFSKSINGVLRMSDLFSAKKKLAKGEYFTVDWLPGSGTVVTVDGGAPTEPIKEPEFFNALMKIWLGNSPADWQLKDALLGKQASTPNN
jgi:Chalcone isomerase-like